MGGRGLGWGAGGGGEGACFFTMFDDFLIGFYDFGVACLARHAPLPRPLPRPFQTPRPQLIGLWMVGLG